MALTTLPIRTARLVLRRFRLDDRDAFAAMRRHPDVARYQSWDADYGDDQADAFVAEMTTAEVWRPGHWTQLAVEHDGSFVGDVAFRPDPLDDVAELGYSLAPASQRQGFATEAVGALAPALGVGTVVARCDPRNDRSIAVLERVGFVLDRVDDGERVYRLAISGTSTFGP